MDNRRRWLWVSLIGGGTVLAIALLTTLLTMGGGAGTYSAVTPPSAPSPSATSTATPTPALTPTATPTRLTMPSAPAFGQAGPPGIGWNAKAAPHTLVLEMSAPGPVHVRMGWRVPTSASRSGTTSGYMSTWSTTMRVYGAPYYAEFYIVYGGATVPLTCRISVDGHLRVEKTATGAFGGLMCVG